MKSEEHATFWEHLYAFRDTLIRVFLTAGLGIVLAFVFYDKLFAVLTLPLKEISASHCEHPALTSRTLKSERLTNTSTAAIEYKLPPNASFLASYPTEAVREIQKGVFSIPPQGFIEVQIPLPCQELVVLGPIEGMIITLKVSLWVGLITTSPLWLLWIFRFLAPALEAGMYRLVLPFLGLSFLFVLGGFAFAFFVTIPIANEYLYSFNRDLGSNLWSLSSYLNYTLTLLIANACLFECCIILLFLVHFGIFSAKGMIAKRRHMIVAAFILAALITPPDVLTQFLVAIPLMIIYEIAILYARFRERVERKSGLEATSL